MSNTEEFLATLEEITIRDTERISFRNLLLLLQPYAGECDIFGPPPWEFGNILDETGWGTDYLQMSGLFELTGLTVSMLPD